MQVIMDISPKQLSQLKLEIKKMLKGWVQRAQTCNLSTRKVKLEDGELMPARVTQWEIVLKQTNKLKS
jgi:hypothetical protein